MKISLPLFVTLVSLTHVSLSLPLSGDKPAAKRAISETEETPGGGATNVFGGLLNGGAGSTLLGSDGGNGLLGGNIGGGFDSLGGGIENPAAGALSAVTGLLRGVGDILPARRDADWESNKTPGDGATNIFDGVLGGDAGSTWLGAGGGNGPLGGNINGGFDALNGGEGDIAGDALGTVTGILPARGA